MLLDMDIANFMQFKCCLIGPQIQTVKSSNCLMNAPKLDSILKYLIVLHISVMLMFQSMKRAYMPFF